MVDQGWDLMRVRRNNKQTEISLNSRETHAQNENEKIQMRVQEIFAVKRQRENRLKFWNIL